MLYCHRGQSHHPPEQLKPGDVLTDAEGRDWAYSGESGGGRDGAIFVIHQERDHGLPTCSPPILPEVVRVAKGDTTCVATTYQYSEELRVIRYDYDTEKKKEFQPQFLFNNKWNAGAGSQVWPFYGFLDADSGKSIIEVEGEKCVDVLRFQGIAAITHPGHQRDEASCRARYAGLAAAGIKTVYYISDNDSPGRKKAAGFLAAAKLSQIELRVIPAESICEVPEGGSVDDMPSDQLRSLLATAIKAAAGVQIAPLSRISYGKIKKALQDFYATNPSSAADIQAGIADIASCHDASVFDTRRIWDSLEEDYQVANEALGATAAIARRQELEEKRKAIKLIDYLPEAICGAIEELTGNLACDPLTAIATVLTTASGVFKAGHRIDAGDGLFVKEPVVWTVISGYSGSGKSPIMRHLCRNRLRLVVEHYNQISQQRQEEWEARYGCVAKNKRPEEPYPLATCVTNFTTEKLNGILADNHGEGLGTFIYSEEVKEILGNLDEYKSKGKGRGRETFLTLFDGNVDSQHRIGRRAKMVVGKVQNALLGAVQPGVFRQMIEEGDDAGLFARCLMVPLINEYVEPNFFRSPEEIQAVHMAEQCLEAFYLRCLGVKPIVLRLERDAVELFAALSRDTYNKAQAVSLESQRAVFGKRLGYILQIALTMHLCRVAAGEMPADELYVSKQAIARATIFVDLLQGYAILEQQESQMQRHGVFDLSRRIHVWAKNQAGGCTPAEFSATCIPLRYRATIKTAHVKAAMEQLVSMGLGEWETGSGSKTVARFIAIGRFPD